MVKNLPRQLLAFNSKGIERIGRPGKAKVPGYGFHCGTKKKIFPKKPLTLPRKVASICFKAKARFDRDGPVPEFAGLPIWRKGRDSCMQPIL
jgi:hypothetical protein